MDSSNVNKNDKVPAKREKWERPVLRRLAANEAEGGSSYVDDGNQGGGNTGHHRS